MKKYFYSFLTILMTFFALSITVNAESYWENYFDGKPIYPTGHCSMLDSGERGLVEWKDLNQNHIIMYGGCGDSGGLYFTPYYYTQNLIFNDVTNLKVESNNTKVVTVSTKPYTFDEEKREFEEYIKMFNSLTDEEFLERDYSGEYEKKPTWWEYNGFETEPTTWWEAYKLPSEPKNAVEVISYAHDLGKADLTLSATGKENIKIHWLVQARDFGPSGVGGSEGLIEILNNLDKYKDVIPEETEIKNNQKYNFTYYITQYEETEDLSKLISTLKGKNISVLFDVESGSNYEIDTETHGHMYFVLNGNDIKNTVGQGFTYKNTVSLGLSSKKSQIDALVDAKFKLYIDFTYHGVLPTTTPFNIDLAYSLSNYFRNQNECDYPYFDEYDNEDDYNKAREEYEKCNSKSDEIIKEYLAKEYTLLYYNPDTRKMEVIKEHIKNDSLDLYQNDAIEIDFDHFSSYVLVASDEYKLNDVDVKETYEIKYELNGGTNNEKNPSFYEENNKEIILNSPTKYGYTFNGWYTDSKFTNKVTSIKAKSNKDITLYAKWTVNKYTVKFNANGGSGKMSNINMTYNKAYTLTANAFKRTGYSFVEWNTKADGSGISYKNKAEVKYLTGKNGATVTLYAIWKKNTYTITYSLNGGTNSTSNPSTYTVTTSTITLKSPKKTGYTFAGWYSDSKYKTKVTSIKKGSTGNKTLYAKWTVNKYTVKFNANGGSGKMSNKTMSYNKTYTLTTNAFKKTGYKFVEWNTKKDGTGTSYTNKDKVKNLTSKNKGTVTLYAIWKKVTYKITYKLDGGTNSTSNPSTYTVTSSTITLKSPKRTGYTFAGWYSDSKFKTKVTSIKKGSTGNKTLYAKWTVNKYTVKFNANGGSGKMSNKTMSYNKTYTLTTNAFKKTGYKFVEWNTKKDGTGTSYTNKDKVKNLTSKNKGTITLYAIWEKVNTEENGN